MTSSTGESILHILNSKISEKAMEPQPPHIKYAEYFKKSKEFETKKVEMALVFWGKNQLS